LVLLLIGSESGMGGMSGRTWQSKTNTKPKQKIYIFSYSIENCSVS